jgi:hypothetical protein
VSDAGIVYYQAVVEGGSGYSGYYKLDTNSGVITNYHIDGPDTFVDLVPQDFYLRSVISSDNSHVFANAKGQVFSIDTATDTVAYARSGPGCCSGSYDLALSSNQTSLAATSYIFDSNLNAESFLTLNDRESIGTSYVYGTKFSPDGSLLFQPSTAGIDVFDGKLGTLRARVALPIEFSANYDALVADGEDNVLIAITNGGIGIAVVDLTSLAAPPVLPYVNRGRSFSSNTGPSANAPENTSEPGENAAGSTLQLGHSIPHVTTSVFLPFRR